MSTRIIRRVDFVSAAKIFAMFYLSIGIRASAVAVFAIVVLLFQR